MQCPTIRIKADIESGYIVINEFDYIEGEHQPFDEAAPEAKPRRKPKAEA